MWLHMSSECEEYFCLHSVHSKNKIRDYINANLCSGTMLVDAYVRLVRRVSRSSSTHLVQLMLRNSGGGCIC